MLRHFYCIPDPFDLTWPQFFGYLSRMADITEQTSGSRDHKAFVERMAARSKRGRHG